MVCFKVSRKHMLCSTLSRVRFKNREIVSNASKQIMRSAKCDAIAFLLGCLFVLLSDCLKNGSSLQSLVRSWSPLPLRSRSLRLCPVPRSPGAAECRLGFKTRFAGLQVVSIGHGQACAKKECPPRAPLDPI